MFIVWIFIVAVVAILVVYLVSNKSCCCGEAGIPQPEPKPTSPRSSGTPPTGDKATGGK